MGLVVYNVAWAEAYLPWAEKGVCAPFGGQLG